ncbi:Sec-independent protein translocase protein TatB [Gilvimarinus sp. SDUM040013]|uniref:Sec-independent protein translocase protein TatB n=1 Tax=Gilvimarinus gilvus TaxID=3058038 RepID=A0ABU4RV61_9GAMM|nr:Sec-independent protein translocase protein TatB [Gilvimarinus sp. SDUM040013]MDO3387869.1 Sec-independent protein translocase protein TatB [Gilvimarinus sp. SDUM040013]MDX6848760.1 Sec-independent protein translocase protein TatB [Gilvimarinus sp. SDUM040013]
MGFFELLLIAIVSLVVIGPERLPETVRAVSLWVGRLKRSLRETRSEIEKQIGADDIRRQLHNEEIMRNLEATKRDIEQAMEPERAERMQKDYGAPTEAPDHAHSETPPDNTEASASSSEKS